MSGYQPGDIVNHHVLGSDNQWHPLAVAASVPTNTAEEAGGSTSPVAEGDNREGSQWTAPEPQTLVGATGPEIDPAPSEDGVTADPAATEGFGSISRAAKIGVSALALVMVGSVALAVSVGGASSSPSASPTPQSYTSGGAPSSGWSDSTPDPVVRAVPISERKLLQIVKNPDAAYGDAYVVYASVDQLDAATGDEIFRGSVAASNTLNYGFFDGENAVFVGSGSQLARVVQGDIVRMEVTVDGSLTYDTQIGGSTTVPQFSIDSIKRVGRVDY